MDLLQKDNIRSKSTNEILKTLSKEEIEALNYSIKNDMDKSMAEYYKNVIDQMIIDCLKD